jgi:peptidoglycan-associated lipoprotein
MLSKRWGLLRRESALTHRQFAYKRNYLPSFDFWCNSRYRRKEALMTRANQSCFSCFALLVTATLLGGCAKRPAVVAETSSPPPVVVATPAPEPKPVSAEVRDLDSLISRIVLHFGFDEVVLLPEDQRQLQKLADTLRTMPTARIRISGNCDDRGTEEYNLALGQRRAEVAKKYLANLGIDAARIDTISFGFEKPVDTRHNEEAWAANRRDEFAPIGER